MTEVDEKLEEELTEIWATEGGIRHRVYRGNIKAHIAWKLEHHKKNQPEVHLVPRK